MAKASIVGSGLIGRAWSIVFARAGWEVSAWDPDAATRDGFAAAARADAEVLAAAGLIPDAAALTARITVAETLADCVAGTAFVQENGPERVEVKQALFAELDALAPPEAVLASSTSAITASRFTEALPGRARCLVGHPVNPPHLVPLVELCGAPWTAPEVLERARETYRAVGQTPVTVNAEVEGFVLNRLQGALLAEAFRLVEDGVISAEELDLTLTDGLARRWSFIGPFATIELNAPGGIPDYCARYTGFYKRLAADPAGPGVFDEASMARLLESWPHAPEPGRLAERTAWRNARLAALSAHLGAAD
ncbi:3-hydroxyacyl-CoA dehydrogenase [Paralimibaculum aggregatum]|uniref:3-hydroxyacyl-CoA dehydrogenase n=1 Tax=Paralimibaculum aggregatum TaxID=3036245 RepID=A0ABQ6LMS0_9RHOB|nr:3-hydroxyacyl-CoA dehydrogenase [Limibaculum sp. NKW23]GMG84282.1 3-hydroxyacyl-CoA dehydrogenase [Limibaculum sp. NKW23]